MLEIGQRLHFLFIKNLIFLLRKFDIKSIFYESYNARLLIFFFFFSDSNGKTPISELLSLDKDNLTIQFSEMKSFNLSVVDDGWWHHVFITWFNNVISVYLDFSLIISEPYGKDKTLPI